MSSMTEIVTAESRRLDGLGISYRYIHCCEGSPVVIVDGSTMESLMRSMVAGQFVSMSDDGSWSAYYIDDDGSLRYRNHLTESKAYRMVLGYPIGRQPIHTRYAGQIPKVKRKKTRSRH